LGITHSKVSGAAASSDPTKVGGPDWNDDHVIPDKGIDIIKLSHAGAMAYATGLSADTTGNKKWDLPNESWDTHGFHDNSTNPSRFTIPTGMDGVYLLNYTFYVSATALNTVFYNCFYVSGSSQAIGAQLRPAIPQTYNGTTCTGIFSLTSGQYVECGYVAAGSTSGAYISVYFSIAYLGPKA
jgi:hypothetical protein